MVAWAELMQALAPARDGKRFDGGTRVATIKDVAEQAGVAKSTVSRVFNGASVSQETRRRVEAVVQQLNFKPNAQARGLSLRRSHLIGVVVPEIARPFYGEILVGIESALTADGYDMVLCSTNNSKGRELALTKLLGGKRVDGLIIVTPRSISFGKLKQLQNDREMPVVLVDGSSTKFSSVSVDSYTGSYLATEHLLRLGHRRVGLIAGLETEECRERVRGYAEALKKYGCPFVHDLVRPGDYLFTSGGRAMAELLDLAEPPTAVFATSDLMAIGALKTLESRGIAVPGDIALVGFDDIEAAQWTTPTLTTVRQPMRRLGELGGAEDRETGHGKGARTHPDTTRLRSRGPGILRGGTRHASLDSVSFRLNGGDSTDTVRPLYKDVIKGGCFACFARAQW